MMPECNNFPRDWLSMTKASQPKRLITLVAMGGLSQVGSSREGVEAFVARWSFTQEFTTTHHGFNALLISHSSLTTILLRLKNHAHVLGRNQDQQKFARVKLITLNFARMDRLLIMVFPVIRILTSASFSTSDHLVRMCSSTLKNSTSSKFVLNHFII